MKDVLWFDTETFCELDLKVVGMSRYARHPSLEIILASFALNDEPVSIVETLEEWDVVEYLKDLIKSPNVIKIAHNAPFDMQVTKHAWGAAIRPDDWRCSMVQGYGLGLPGDLKTQCAVVGLSVEESKREGKGGIHLFCKPQKVTKNQLHARANKYTHPLEWADFRLYGGGDVTAMRAKWKKLAPYLPISDHEWKQWARSYEANEHGLPVDRQLAEKCVELAAVNREKMESRISELTGVVNPNSVQQMRNWLEREGIETEDLTKDTVEDLLTCSDPLVTEVLECYQQLSMASLDKFTKLLTCADEDDRLRFCFQYKGASRTGRESARNFQPQNLASGQEDVTENLELAIQMAMAGDVVGLEMTFGALGPVLASLVRPCIKTPSGLVLTPVDFSAIEARIASWLAGEEWRMEVFRTHGKIYEASASAMFKIPLSEFFEYKKVNGKHHPLRKKGKVAELALGYQGWVGALVNMGALKQGLTIDELAPIAKAWREANPKVVELWYELNRGAAKCIRTGQTVPCAGGKLVFSYVKPFMFMTLPSGRRLAYLRPAVADKGDGKIEITYEGSHPKTKRWTRISGYGGKFFENACQAITADIMRRGVDMLQDELSLTVIGTVHDEAIPEVEEAEADIAATCEVLARGPDWAPGLPLKAEGFISNRYKK